MIFLQNARIPMDSVLAKRRKELLLQKPDSVQDPTI